MQLAAIQTALTTANLSGWLFYDFRGSDPLGHRILGLKQVHATRRWFYYIPASGEPRKLCHAIEPGSLDALPGEKKIYRRFSELQELLGAILKGQQRVAMQYSPLGAIPYLSRVDAGTIELVRSLGPEVVSSGDLVQRFEALLDAAELASHRRASDSLRAVVDETFAEVARRLREKIAANECDIQDFMMARFAAKNLETDFPPIVAINEHAADPHYGPTRRTASSFAPNQLLLIDLWAKEKKTGAVYSDITWTTWTGPGPIPAELRAIAEAVIAGRDAGVERARRAARGGGPVSGGEVDDAVRETIRERGFAEHFIHRTGHSIKQEVHAAGANIDNFENPDSRTLLPGSLFSIEPGVYIPGKWGIRSEIDVYFGAKDAEITGLPVQTELRSLIA